MKKVFALFLGLVLLTPTTSYALLDLIDIDASAGISVPTPTGSIKQAGQPSVDLANTLGLGNGSDTIVKLDFKHFLPIIPNIYVHHLPVDVAGDKTLATASLPAFAGLPAFTGNVAQHSEISINQNDLGLYWGVPFLGVATLGMLHANFGLNVRSIDFHATTDIKGTVAGVSTTNRPIDASFNTYIPMLYLEADFSPPFISILTLEVEVKTLPLGGSGISEYSAELKIKPLPLVYIGVGYSSYSIILDPSAISSMASGVPTVNLNFAGPYAVLGIDL